MEKTVTEYIIQCLKNKYNEGKIGICNVPCFNAKNIKSKNPYIFKYFEPLKFYNVKTVQHKISFTSEQINSISPSLLYDYIYDITNKIIDKIIADNNNKPVIFYFDSQQKECMNIVYEYNDIIDSYIIKINLRVYNVLKQTPELIKETETFDMAISKFYNDVIYSNNNFKTNNLGSYSTLLE